MLDPQTRGEGRACAGRSSGAAATRRRGVLDVDNFRVMLLRLPRLQLRRLWLNILNRFWLQILAGICYYGN